MEVITMKPVRYNYNNRDNNNQMWLPSFFNDFFDDGLSWANAKRNSMPAVNVTEDDKEYKVELAIPGLQKEDCKVRFNDGILTVSADKTVQNDGKKYLRKEFSYNHFEQSLTLPDDVDQTAIAASVKDGVLSIDLPKMDEKKEEERWQTVEIV